MTEELTQPRGHLEGTADAPVVLVDRTLDATTREVWDAWTRPERLARWLGAAEGPLDRSGNVVRMAMAAAELPDDFDAADNPVTFTVLEAVPPDDAGAGRLVLTFDDSADPGGTVTVDLASEGPGRCRLVLRHELTPRPEAITNAAGFGAGWEGFLDWLEDVLAGREHGSDDRYEQILPAWEGLASALAH